MSKYFKLALVLLIASCGGPSKPPRNLDNACEIIKERPQYFRAMKRVESKWGVPVSVQMATIHQESKFVGDARTPHKYVLGVIPMGRQSSAYGYAQALDNTWDEYKRETRSFGADRDDINDATDFMGWYMRETTTRLGIPLNDARNQYLAYHEGRAGYSRGSYNSKGWLLAVADKVGARALTYRSQMIACGKG
ncbi:transglycosylase SLT domain-containing protein [Albirhodobacter sp. R86504]|jgi:hypothetical protein|uniref:transglycosylase SLT domain-containing protein n=1 Tax=Albirhodobacter sp. R86504 TaxID=3093848 RepID=UPI00366C7E7B